MSNNENNENNNNDIYSDPAYEIVKKKKRRWPVILGVCLAGAAAAIALPIIFLRPKTVNFSEFVSVAYDGISGYATPKSVIDTDGLYTALAGKETDTARLEAYKNFADSVQAAVTGEKVANGDTLEVNVSYNDELRENTGYKVKDETFTVTAEGIDPGKSVNLFEDASINITGISPDAAIAVENKSSDEYLKTLKFTAEKSTVANGDKVAIKCDVTDDELAAHGFTTTSFSAMYDVEGLSEYLDIDNIDKALLDKITETDTELIKSETSNDTYRMIYKLTNNADYLSVPNTETAEEIELAESYLLKRKADADKNGNPENLIIAIHKAKLKVQDKEETGYFAFIYPDSYVTADGKLELNTDTLVDTIAMNKDLEALKSDVIKSREDRYQVTYLEPAAFEEKPAEVSETTAIEGETQETEAAETTAS